jgi:hypothetical protein
VKVTGDKYGIKEYKELLEKALQDYKNPMECPFGMDPYSNEGVLYRQSKREVLQWCLEMLPKDNQ